MGIKFSRVRVRGFSDPIEKAEAINDWSWWVLFGAVVVMVILVILKMSERI